MQLEKAESRPNSEAGELRRLLAPAADRVAVGGPPQVQGLLPANVTFGVPVPLTTCRSVEIVNEG
jgi:hypothetical protein